MPFGFSKLQKNRDFPELAGQDVVGLFEPGIEFEGKMVVTSGLVRLNSHFKGEFRSEGIVVLADQGEIEGEVRSKIVSIAGKIKGSVHATERVEIKAQGVVLGDIYTPSLIVEPGGYFDGQCHMPGPAPVEQATESKKNS